MTRFWIMELQGRKLVRLLPPSEFARAHASDIASFCPTLFSVDLMDPNFDKFPEADGMLVYEALLEPGDVLFIPEGWGHKCVNRITLCACCGAWTCDAFAGSWPLALRRNVACSARRVFRFWCDCGDNCGTCSSRNCTVCMC